MIQQVMTFAKVHTCSYPDMLQDCNGDSGVFDGVAYLSELGTSRDTCINTSSIKFLTADLLTKILPAMEHEPTIVSLPRYE